MYAFLLYAFALNGIRMVLKIANITIIRQCLKDGENKCFSNNQLSYLTEEY